MFCASFKLIDWGAFPVSRILVSFPKHNILLINYFIFMGEEATSSQPQGVLREFFWLYAQDLLLMVLGTKPGLAICKANLHTPYIIFLAPVI